MCFVIYYGYHIGSLYIKNSECEFRFVFFGWRGTAILC